MQGAEIQDAVNAKHHGLAVDHELHDPVLQRRLDNPRISIGPIIAVPGDQAHAVTVALQPQPVAVVFHFVELVRGVGDGCSRAASLRFRRNESEGRRALGHKSASTALTFH
jgi:hypothetical protein